MNKPIRMFANNVAKQRREIEKGKKKADVEELKALIINRNNEIRQYLSQNSDGRRYSPTYAKYIKYFKEKLFVSLKQLSFDPINRNELWELKDKKLCTLILLGREIGQLGIENIYINVVEHRYKGMMTRVTSDMFRSLGINDGYNQMTRFLRLVTDYTREISTKKEVNK